MIDPKSIISDFDFVKHVCENSLPINLSNDEGNLHGISYVFSGKSILEYTQEVASFVEKKLLSHVLKYSEDKK